MNYDQPCRPTPSPAKSPIPSGWRLWSHGNDAAVFRTILGTERPSGMVLIERCCGGTQQCGNCVADVPEAVAG